MATTVITSTYLLLEATFLKYLLVTRSTRLSFELFLDNKEQQQGSRSLSNFFLPDHFRRGDRNPREKQTRERGENGARFLLFEVRARERANGVLLSRETSGPNSSV